MHLTEANSIAQCQVTVRCVQKFIALTKKEEENKSGVKTRETRNKDRLGELEQVGEKNESGRRANTYITSACVFRSLSFEPDMLKDSTPVSSTPSKRHNGGKEHKRENVMCKFVHVKQKHQCYSHVESNEHTTVSTGL